MACPYSSVNDCHEAVGVLDVLLIMTNGPHETVIQVLDFRA